MKAGFTLTWLSVVGLLVALSGGVRAAETNAAAGMRTADGRYDLRRIRMTFAYLLPSDRRMVPDWKDRLTYFADRIRAFHAREFNGQSELKIDIVDDPCRIARTAEDLRAGDANDVFFRTMDEVRQAEHWPPAGEGFPILLVFSDINWRELDDFRRERRVGGTPQHEGHVSREGRHFPGAASGGARSLYVAREGLGLGLLSADGWRVPYSGSDCVVYHEGIGHPVGLPHPEPIDDSVMGTAQYQWWIHQTRVAEHQKRALGWAPLATPADRSRDLFSAFTALPQPLAPRPGEAVDMRFTWPREARVQSLSVEVQTDLFGRWREAARGAAGAPPASLSIGSFAEPTPVGYRARAVLEDGQKAELWGYFQVKAAGS